MDKNYFIEFMPNAYKRVFRNKGTMTKYIFWQ